MKLEQHELSAAFPSMTDTELIALTDDITAYGQRDAGMLFEGKVLDGWRRYQACELAGVEFRADQYIGDDPVSFVMSRNAHRRHLTASQRAAAIVLCSEWKPTGRPEKGAPGSPFRSVPEMATVAGTSERTIQQAKRAVESGQGEAVRDGKISAKAAAEAARPVEPDDDQSAPTPYHPDEPDDEEEADQAAQFKADFAAFYADDQNRHMVDQIRQLTAEVTTLKVVRDGLMRTNAELVRTLNYWKRTLNYWKRKAEAVKA